MMKNMGHHPAIFLIIMTFSLSYPFFWQSFAIDDPFTIWLGQTIQEKPLRPYDADSFWYDEPATFFNDFRNPPLVAYYSFLIQSVAGKDETSFHLFFFPFYLLCAFSMYGLCRNWVHHPLAATLTFLCIPAVLVQSHHIMPDMACLSFFMAGIALFRTGCQKDSMGLFLLAGLIGGLSGLSKYQGLIWLPVIVAYIYCIKPQNSLRKQLVAPLVALLLNLTWFLGSFLIYGRWHVFENVRHCEADIVSLVIKAFVLIIHFGGNMVVLLLLVRGGKNLFHSVVSLVMSVFALFLLVEYYEPVDVRAGVFIIVFLFSGFLLLVKIFAQSCPDSSGEKLPDTDKNATFLKTWIVLGCLTTITLTPFMAGRYLLLWLAPAVILLFLHFGDATRPMSSRLRMRIAVAGMVLLGTLISVGDYHFSQAAKILALSVSRDLWGNNVHFTGHWGFQYYMEEAGFQPFSDVKDLPAGSYLVRASQFSGQPVPGDLLSSALAVNRYQISPWFPFIVMDPRLQTSLYIHFPGPLPWSFGQANPIEISVYQIFRFIRLSPESCINSE